MAQSNSISNASPAQPPEPLVDVKAAARFLGVPQSWIYSAAADGRIPHHFVGRYLRLRISELEEWLQDGRPAGGVGEAHE